MLKTNEPLQSGDGKYSTDEAFEKGQAVFKQYARQLWQKNVLEYVK